MQERTALPSRWTVQAPHSPAPHELAAFQVEFVAQHPQQRCVAVDLDVRF
jgi:hypothetical protein